MTVFHIYNLAPGIAYFGLTFVMLFTGIQVSKDRTTALLLRLYASPMKPADYVTGYTLPVCILGIVQMAICFAAAFLVGLCKGYAFSFSAILLSMLLLVPSLLMFTGIGILFGSAVSEKAAPGLCSIIISAVGMIGGIWMDLDGIGGLTLTVRTDAQLRAINGVIDGYNYQFGLEANSDFLTDLGEQHMNGKQAQAYARYRRNESDIQRTERQREVLKKIFDRLQEMSLTELSRLAMSAMARMETNLSLSDIIALIPVLYGMKDAGFEQLSLPFEGEYQARTVSGMAVLVPDLKAAQKRLADFING